MDVPEESVSVGGEFDDKIFPPSRLNLGERENSHR